MGLSFHFAHQSCSTVTARAHTLLLSEVRWGHTPTATLDIRRSPGSHREFQEPGSQQPEMHSWYLSQAIPLRMGRGNNLACHTRIQIKNFCCLQKSLHSLSWGGLPDYKHLFSGDSFISHFSVKESAGRSSFR